MKEKSLFIGGIITSLLAVSCCIGPVLFLLLGITGLGFLSRLEWLRPYLLAVTFILVGISFYYAYGKGSKCGSEGTCNPGTRRVNRSLFWVLIGFAIFGLSFPSVVGRLLR